MRWILLRLACRCLILSKSGLFDPCKRLHNFARSRQKCLRIDTFWPISEASMTIKEFAERLGMSTATISRAFTPGASIRPETRAHILDQARTLGYAPNPSARNLARSYNRLIGLDCPANPDMLADPFLVELARGVQAALEPGDYGL